MNSQRRFCLAPMMDCTDRYYRYFLRQISKNVFLYTEMVHTGAILFGHRERFLKFDEVEHPVALQLGGSNPVDLAKAAKIAQEWGYDEVNLNVGCPSDRVQSGSFGACLMGQKEKVSDCVKAMQDATTIPITVKTRIGIDNQDSYEFTRDFCGEMVETGVETLIIHARKAWLQGLSPKENREKPPLDYPRVYQMKQEFKDTEIIINGGINTMEASKEHLQHVDGVMVGREIYSNPYLFANVDSELYGEPDPTSTREEVLEKMIPFVDKCKEEGEPFHRIGRHILGLYHGQIGGKNFRRFLTEEGRGPQASSDLLQKWIDFRRSKEK
jgi:tRNA-dihydrouridine synthase A